MIVMNVLELKGGILELVSRLEDEQALANLYKYAKAVSETTLESDWWDKLYPVQQSELTLAVEEPHDEAKLVSHEEAMKTLSKWRE
jgi:hypothetical protein